MKIRFTMIRSKVLSHFQYSFLSNLLKIKCLLLCFKTKTDSAGNNKFMISNQKEWNSKNYYLKNSEMSVCLVF